MSEFNEISLFIEKTNSFFSFFSNNKIKSLLKREISNFSK